MIIKEKKCRNVLTYHLFHDLKIRYDWLMEDSKIEELLYGLEVELELVKDDLSEVKKELALYKKSRGIS